MTELDVMESLKQKEEELENLFREAREKASQIKKDALRRVEEIKSAKSKESGDILEEYKRSEMEKINKEAEAIKQDAAKEVQDLKRLAEEREEKAVEMAVSYILEGEH